jgi:hypothetical protein
MARLYSTGPVGCYIGNAAGIITFLGHGKKAPDIDIETETIPVECDLGGAVQMDQIYGGQRGKVSVLLSRYNEGAVAILQDRAKQLALRGIDNPGDIGALLLSEGLFWTLYLRFPYAAKAFQGAGAGIDASPAGYRFLAAYLDSPDKIIVGTTTNRMVQCHFTCLRAFNVTITNTFGEGRFTLFDHNLAGVPVID